MGPSGLARRLVTQKEANSSTYGKGAMARVKKAMRLVAQLYPRLWYTGSEKKKKAVVSKPLQTFPARRQTYFEPQTAGKPPQSSTA